jgi:alpha-1,4-digalacturonate transport system permease protein
VLNAFLVSLGLEPMLFLLDPGQATFWVIFVSIWALMGFYTLILLAGLQAIPAELYEASSIDGAGGWATFWGVTLPLLMPTLFVVLVLSLIRAVQVFDQIFVLTGGGPGTATLYMVQYIYDTGFANQIQRFGLASAASVVLGLALLIFTLIQLWLGNRSEAT